MNMTEGIRISGCHGKGWMDWGGGGDVAVNQVLSAVVARIIDTDEVFNTNKSLSLACCKNLR